MRGTLFLPLSIVLFISCVKEVAINLPSKESKVVVNALMEPNTPPTIHVSLSSPINSSYNKTVNDATVIVYEDGIPIDSLHEGLLGIYRFVRILPKQNSMYRVRVITQSHGITEGEVKIPVSPGIRITSITTQTNLMGSDSYQWIETTVNLSVLLSDIANQNNYYCMALTVGQDTFVLSQYRFDSNTNEWVDTILTRRCETMMYGRTNSPFVEYLAGEANFGFSGTPNVTRVDRSQSAILGSDFSLGGNAFWFTDGLFNGTEQILNFTLSFNPKAYNDCTVYDEVGGEILPFWVYVYSMSESLYRYYSTAYLTPSDPFAEPVTIYTNISNGYGVVAARSIARKVFMIE